MENWQLALVIKPLAFFLLSALVLYPARLAARKWIPEGRFKRLLLTRIHGRDSTAGRAEAQRL